MRRVIFAVSALLLAVQFLAVEALAQTTKKVAILETVDKENNIRYGVRLMIRGNLSQAITNTPGYEGYDRVDMDQILGEHDFQRTGNVSDEQIKKLGEMTGAAYILVAEAAMVDESNVFIMAKILNVESARIEKVSNVQSGIDAEELQESCVQLAESLFGLKSISNKTTQAAPAPAPAPVQQAAPAQPAKQRGGWLPFGRNKEHKENTEQQNQSQPHAVIYHYSKNGKDDNSRAQERRYRAGYKLAERINIIGVIAHYIAMLMSVKILNRKILHSLKHTYTHL